MKQGDINRKRFVRSIRGTMENLARDAKCYGYNNDPDYMEIKEDLKYCLRRIEDGEVFAGKLLYKNIRNIAPNTALQMAAKAKDETERLFFISIAQMNEARIQQTDPDFRMRTSILYEKEPVLRWSDEGFGALACPHCHYGCRRGEWVDTPHKYCPECGKRLRKPIIKKLIRNAIRCNICGDEVESTSTHHNAKCKCGACSADGGLDYIKRSGNLEDFTEISEYKEIDLEEAMEDEQDITTAKDAYNEYLKNGGKSRPISELWEELGLKENVE